MDDMFRVTEKAFGCSTILLMLLNKIFYRKGVVYMMLCL